MSEGFSGFPLSPQQKQVWALGADGTVCNAVASVSIEGVMDADLLKRALHEVIARHEILRTTYNRQPGMKLPVQVVNANLSPSWSEHSISSLSDEQRRARVQEILRAEAGSPFDLAHGPIVRVTLLRLAETGTILVLCLPSMCADEITLSNIVRELVDASSSANTDETFQYADYSAFANEALEQQGDQAQTANLYWAETQARTVSDIQLPLQRRPLSIGSFEPEAIPVEQISLLSIDDPSAFLAACWHIFLWRITRRNPIVLERISDGRNHDELNGAMGLFSRSIPIAYEFQSTQTFSSVRHDLTQAWTTAYERQDHLAPRNEGTKGVSFSAVDISEIPSVNNLAFSGWRSQAVVTNFLVQLRVTSEKRLHRVELLYDPQCLSRSTMERLASQFAELARAAANHPESQIADLPILDDFERKQILAEFNQTSADFPRNRCIHELFEQAAARFPDRPALRFGKTCFTYAELNRRANQLAHLLRRSGVRPGVAVPLCLDRCADMIVALMGVLKAGGAYVPLVPDNPKARLAQQLAETRSAILITEQKFVGNLPEFSGKLFCLDRDSASLANESDSNPDPAARPADSVYIIYTSGSTGLPKGVEVSHANLVNYSSFIANKVNPEAEPLNFASVSTLAADLGNTAIFPALISGACLHVIDYDMALSADRFAGYSGEYPIDVLKITPSHLSSLIATAHGAQVLPRRCLVLGGEAAPWDLVARVAKLGTCKVINHYGPTEATVGCCTFAVRESDVSAWSPATVPIGRPIANVQVYILDERLRPVPIGVPGELCVGGTGIAKGYLNQPEPTAERFIADPFAQVPGARIYRTGDLARFLPDGNIEFLGRLDEQVKIRGFRVEPAEVESVLKTHPAVQQVIVRVSTDNLGENRLLAYIVADRKSAPVAELRSYLQERLPEYMVPAAIIGLDQIPLTRNGKIDMAALPSPDPASVEHAVLAPRNSIEEGLVEIWRQVLKVDRVGITDNFFDIGGHSLLATQVISRIRSMFHVQLPLRSLFDTPTVAGLAEQISALPRTAEDEEVARLLQELEGLSDEEAERLLGEEMRNAAEGSGND